MKKAYCTYDKSINMKMAVIVNKRTLDMDANRTNVQFFFHFERILYAESIFVRIEKASDAAQLEKRVKLIKIKKMFVKL